MPLSVPTGIPALSLADLDRQARERESIYKRAAEEEARTARQVNPAAYVEVPAEFYHIPRTPKVPFFTPAALVAGMARLK